MICPKCAAPMQPERSLHYQSNGDYTVDQNDVKTLCPSFHCVICGTYVDRLIVANRARQADERRLLAQAETIATWASMEAVAS